MAAPILLVFVSAFFGILALFLLAMHLFSPSRAVARRLEKLGRDKGRDSVVADAQAILRRQTPDQEALFRLPFLKSVRNLVAHSGVPVSPLRFLACNALSTALAFCLVQIFGRLPISLVAAVAVAFLPYTCLLHLRGKRQQKFEEQLPDTLTMIARSLRAGHSLTAALELVASEQPEPTSSLFRTAYEQQQLGARTVDALLSVLEQINSVDFHFFVTIIRVNSETGGNLSEVLEKLAETVRSRLQIRRQVHTYSAEGRLSGYVLLALPIVVFFAFNVRSPKYMEPFFKEAVCQWSLLAAAVAQLIGFLIIRKIVRIRI